MVKYQFEECPSALTCKLVAETTNEPENISCLFTDAAHFALQASKSVRRGKSEFF